MTDSSSCRNAWLTLVAEREISGKRAHDARIAVAATLHGIRHLITFNGDDFARFSPLTAVHPREWRAVTAAE